MNWYFEQQGVSHGPLPEDELVLMLRRREITRDTMIWHPGLESWQEIATLKPQWLVTPSVEAAPRRSAVSKVVGEKVAEKLVQAGKPASQNNDVKPGQTGVSASQKISVGEKSGQAGKPVSQKAIAPILKPYVKGEEEKAPPAQGAEKPGLFKMLFGFGKKKA